MKELFIADTISLPNYMALKKDLDIKIELLNHAISEEQKEQRASNYEVEKTSSLFCHLDELISYMEGNRKCYIVEWLFSKGWKWKVDYLSDSLNPPIKLIYGLDMPTDSERDSAMDKAADEKLKHLAFFLQDVVPS